MEELEVYAFERNETSEDIELFLMNTGLVSLGVTRIWAMRTDLQKTLIVTSLNETNLPLQLIASSQMRIENLFLVTVLVNDTDLDIFRIEVVAARGNKFAFKSVRVRRI